LFFWHNFCSQATHPIEDYPINTFKTFFLSCVLVCLFAPLSFPSPSFPPVRSRAFPLLEVPLPGRRSTYHPPSLPSSSRSRQFTQQGLKVFTYIIYIYTPCTPLVAPHKPLATVVMPHSYSYTTPHTQAPTSNLVVTKHPPTHPHLPPADVPKWMDVFGNPPKGSRRRHSQ
jgi:hypothetical protein